MTTNGFDAEAKGVELIRQYFEPRYTAETDPLVSDLINRAHSNAHAFRHLIGWAYALGQSNPLPPVKRPPD